MLDKLLLYLRHEMSLLGELVKLAEVQQDALIRFNISELEGISAAQDSLSKNLRETEEKRIKLLMNGLNISRREAASLRLSVIENKYEGKELLEIKNLRLCLRDLLTKLNNYNATNRALTNRARASIQNIISVFTNNGSAVCNVKV